MDFHVSKIMKRNYSIDTLRTIATFLVVLIHVSAKYIDTAINNLSFNKSFWIANISDSFSRIAVPLFVLISGMFLLGRKESIIQFYKNRKIFDWEITNMLTKYYLTTSALELAQNAIK